MASVFGHSIVAYALGKIFSKGLMDWKFYLLGIACSIIPDADVLAFKLGISYESIWGHRGFTHSIVFSIGMGVIVTLIFYSKHFMTSRGLSLIIYFFLCTLSHSVLDAMTNGGLGVAFFAPFDNSRYFLPWTPIQVSPIGASRFFSEQGVKVILNELIWLGIPAALLMTVVFFWGTSKKNKLD